MLPPNRTNEEELALIEAHPPVLLRPVDGEANGGKIEELEGTGSAE